jgi:hypothetical protein
MSNNRGNDKSILQKIADTVKDIATIATDAANDALKAEAPAPKAREAVVTDVPLAGLGLVSDPMMVPPIALVPARKKQRAATKPPAKKAAKTRAKEKTIVKKVDVKKAGKTSAVGKSKKAAKKTAKKAFKKTREIATRNAAKKKSSKKARRVR